MTRAGVTVTECEGTLVISLIIKKMESSQILNTVILPQNFSSPSHLRENVQFLIKPILRSRDMKTNSDSVLQFSQSGKFQNFLTRST